MQCKKGAIWSPFLMSAPKAAFRRPNSGTDFPPIIEGLAEAEAKIAAARTSALTELESVASEAAQTIVEKLAGVAVPADSAASAVKKVLSHG